MMLLPCKVVRKRDDLTEEEWSFSVINEQIVLNYYCYLERPTKRHKHRVVRYYDRLNHRDRTVKVDDVPFPDDVAAEALAEIRARFRVVKDFQR